MAKAQHERDKWSVGRVEAISCSGGQAEGASISARDTTEESDGFKFPKGRVHSALATRQIPHIS